MQPTRRPESKWFAPPMMFSYVMALMAGFLSYNSFQNDTGRQVDRLQYRVDELEGENKYFRQIFRGRFTFMVDINDKANFLCRSNPECDHRFENLRVPE